MRWKPFQCACVHAAVSELYVGGQRSPRMSWKAESVHYLLSQLLCIWQLRWLCGMLKPCLWLHVCCS